MFPVTCPVINAANDIVVGNFMIDAQQIDELIRKEGMKPVFADGVILGFRLSARAKKPMDAKQPIRPEQLDVAGGMIEIVFVDQSKQQPLGRYIFDRNTAEAVLQMLADTVKKFDETMEKKDITKLMPQARPARPEGQSSYM